MSHTRSATNSADATRSSGLGKSTKSQDQQCPGCSRGKTLVMPKRRRNVVYGSALGVSGLGVLLGLLILQSFPLAACLTVVTGTAGLLYNAVEFFPHSLATKPQKEMTDGGTRSR